jgi:putative peptidoglycan lipid II flippase
MRQGWRPRVELRGEAALAELWQLFLPGLLGAAILQVNILVSRLLAYSLDESAVSVLYLASRLMELPLGVFTIAVATVFFPLLAKALSAGDEVGFSEAFLRGMRLILGISVPAGIGLITLGEPILECLFLWGAFERADVLATVPLLAIYGFGLPFYSAATFATRGLHASKDMRTPGSSCRTLPSGQSCGRACPHAVFWRQGPGCGQRDRSGHTERFSLESSLQAQRPCVLWSAPYGGA